MYCNNAYYNKYQVLTVLSYEIDTTFCLLLTGYLEQGLMVKDPGLLRKKYFASNMLYFNIISLFPTDLAYLFLDLDCVERVPCPVLVRANRIFR